MWAVCGWISVSAIVWHFPSKLYARSPSSCMEPVPCSMAPWLQLQRGQHQAGGAALGGHGAATPPRLGRAHVGRCRGGGRVGAAVRGAQVGGSAPATVEHTRTPPSCVVLALAASYPKHILNPLATRHAGSLPQGRCGCSAKRFVRAFHADSFSSRVRVHACMHTHACTYGDARQGREFLPKVRTCSWVMLRSQ